MQKINGSSHHLLAEVQVADKSNNKVFQLSGEPETNLLYADNNFGTGIAGDVIVDNPTIAFCRSADQTLSIQHEPPAVPAPAWLPTDSQSTAYRPHHRKSTRCNRCYRSVHYKSSTHFAGLAAIAENCVLPCAVCRSFSGNCAHSEQAFAEDYKERVAMFRKTFENRTGRSSVGLSMPNIACELDFLNGGWSEEQIRQKAARCLLGSYEDVGGHLRADQERYELYVQKMTQSGRPFAYQNRDVERQILECWNEESVHLNIKPVWTQLNTQLVDNLLLLLRFDESQKAAVREALDSSLSLITGAVGTGKTKVAGSVLALLAVSQKLTGPSENVAVVAASEVAVDDLKTSFIVAMNLLYRLHSDIRTTGKDDFFHFLTVHEVLSSKARLPACKKLLIDNAEALNVPTFKAVVVALQHPSHICCIGDPYQRTPHFGKHLMDAQIFAEYCESKSEPGAAVDQTSRCLSVSVMEMLMADHWDRVVTLRVCYHGTKGLFQFVMDRVYGLDCVQFAYPTSTTIDQYKLGERTTRLDYAKAIRSIIRTENLLPHRTVVLCPNKRQKHSLEDLLNVSVQSLDECDGVKSEYVIISLMSPKLGYLKDDLDVITRKKYNKKALIMLTRARTRMYVVGSLDDRSEEGNILYDFVNANEAIRQRQLPRVY